MEGSAPLEVQLYAPLPPPALKEIVSLVVPDWLAGLQVSGVEVAVTERAALFEALPPGPVQVRV